MHAEPLFHPPETPHDVQGMAARLRGHMMTEAMVQLAQQFGVVR